MEQAFYDVSMTMRKSKWHGVRPETCEICHTPLQQKKRGRPRFTCSDRCRQIKRRTYDYAGWIDPQKWAKDTRRAERELKRIEKQVGSLDIPTPDFPNLTLRDRIKIRLEREWPVQYCQVCWRPYIDDTPRRIPACPGRCSEQYMKHQQALEKGLKEFAGKYDPRVDVRVRLGLPIKLCRHCGIPFPDYDRRRVYCSRKCCRNASYARHPVKTCPECGKVYKSKWAVCSKQCANRRYHRDGVFCARCRKAITPGSEILPNEDTRLPRRRKSGPERPIVFCSGKCRDALGWSPKYKFCDQCGELYWPEYVEVQNSQKYCSKGCAQIAANARRDAWRRARAAAVVRHCRQCGDVLPPAQPGGVRQYCDDDCRRIAMNARRRDRRREGPILVRIPQREMVVVRE